MKTQKHPIGNDVQANILQLNLTDLFRSAHDHVIKSSFPGPNDGAIQDLVVVDDGSNVYLCIKTSRGWFKTTALIAV
jgi:hypothetical protein